MKNDTTAQEWIDNASYLDLLRKWRHAPIGDEMFIGELGEYYSKVMSTKKHELSTSQQVSASKLVGW